MNTGKAKPITWFEDNMIVYVDGMGELRAHRPRCKFWLLDEHQVIAYEEVSTLLVNDIILSSVAKDDYRFWICDNEIYGRIEDMAAYNLPTIFGGAIIFDTVHAVINLADIHATIPLDDDIENFLRSIL